MNQRDFYQVLGVPRGASASEIRAAFTRLAKLHHPDLASGSTALPSRLPELQQAYHCLADPQSRAAHDRALYDSERAHFAQQRAVRRHLRRYDRRHPRPQPRHYAQRRWGRIALVAVSAIVLVRIAVLLLR